MLIDTALVERLITAQFPAWSHLPVKPVVLSGWDNRTFHLGDQMTVRMPSAEHYAAQVAKEHTWLPRLAPHLPLPIPVPLAMGQPAGEYPWHWSVYGWLDGDIATRERIDNEVTFAADLAAFLLALQGIDTARAPLAGRHNFYRGGDLAVYNQQTRSAIHTLGEKVDQRVVTEIWDEGLHESWPRPPVWLHGDMAAGNLLVQEGQLCGVIDFGGLAAGDPACDLTIAWTLLGAPGREALRSALSVDDATWARGCAWALWKALIILAGQIDTNVVEAGSAQRVVDELLRSRAEQL